MTLKEIRKECDALETIHAHSRRQLGMIWWIIRAIVAYLEEKEKNEKE